MHSVKGPLYLRCLLEKIEIAKKLFIQDIGDGDEVFIPYELSHSQYPWSYRYYDPIMLIAFDRLTEEKKEYIKLTNIL